MFLVLRSNIGDYARMSREAAARTSCTLTSVNNAQMVRFPSMDNLVDFTRYQRNRAVHIADRRTPLDSTISFVSPDLRAYPRDKEPTVTTF